MKQTILFSVACLVLVGCGLDPTTGAWESEVRNPWVEGEKNATCKLDPACDPEIPMSTSEEETPIGEGCESYWTKETNFWCEDGVVHNSYSYVYHDLDSVHVNEEGVTLCVYTTKSWSGQFDTKTKSKTAGDKCK